MKLSNSDPNTHLVQQIHKILVQSKKSLPRKYKFIKFVRLQNDSHDINYIPRNQGLKYVLRIPKFPAIGGIYDFEIINFFPTENKAKRHLFFTSTG